MIESLAAIDVLRASGWAAALLLVAALAASPAARVLGRAPATRVPKVRRWLGIACAALALVHGAVAVPTYLGCSEGLSQAWAAIAAVPWVRSGALAAALLLPLLVTSFPPAVRLLRVRLWKPLHRLAYVVAALVLHHVLLAPYAPRGWGLALAGALAVLAAARVWRPRRRGADAPDPAAPAPP